MTLTAQINDIVEQAASLLSPPNMDDWSPPPGTPDELAAEQAEYDRRVQEKINTYLADRSDRLACLKAIREATQERETAYKAQAAPWLRMAARQERTRAYVEQLARNVLEAERTAAGFPSDCPYEVELANGTKIGLRLSNPAVRILNIDDLPRRYVEMDPKVLKVEIAKALKAGKVVPGAELTRGDHIHWGR